MVAWEEAHRFGVDVSLTVVVALLFGVISASTAAYGSAPEGLTALLAVAVLVPLAWRRTRPNASAIAVYAISLVEMVLLGTLSPAMVAAVLFSLYSVTVHGRRWAHRTAIVGALVGSALALGPGLGLTDLSQYVAGWMFMAAVALATWAFGLVRRSRRETIEALVDRAQREYPDQPSGPDDTWWQPAHLGGSAPTPEEAVELDRSERRTRSAS